MKRVWDKSVQTYDTLIGAYVQDWENSEWHWVENDAPAMLCDRSAQASAKQGVAADTAKAGTAGSEAQTEHNQLSPFYTQEMHAQHLFDPNQTNELLTAAMAGSGGTNSTIAGEAGMDAARTRNASGFAKTLQQAARDKAKTNAGVSEGVAAQDVLGAKQLNQEGAAGEMGLYGADTDAQLKAMGLRNEDVKAQIEAGKSGWLQNMTGVLSSLGDLAKGASGIKGIGK